jgi:chorismate mutase
VELAFRYGMDAVWIGARTTANPFVVQEVTEAMRGSGIGVMVKNAPSPDVQLWLGAVERCRQVGLTDIVAVHRGFDLFKNGGYRNNPLWEVPIELRRLAPQLPILCDPSHIAGRREPISTLAQTAMNLGFDGLMVEVHPHPDHAFTDAGQQITPAELEKMLGSLVMRQTDSMVSDGQLQRLREEIDVLDGQLLQTLAARLQVAGEIAKVKERDNLAVYQPKRWEQLLRQRKAAATELGLSPEFVEEIFEKIHAESVRVQLGS